MPTATLSSKSQLVLPAEIRRKLGIHPGDRLVVELEGDHAVIRKAPCSDVDALAAHINIAEDFITSVEPPADEKISRKRAGPPRRRTGRRWRRAPHGVVVPRRVP